MRTAEEILKDVHKGFSRKDFGLPGGDKSEYYPELSVLQAIDTARREALEEVRVAVANYMHSEGCSCCQDIPAHEIHTEVLGKLLDVEKYKDGSGFDFSKYRTPKPNT